MFNLLTINLKKNISNVIIFIGFLLLLILTLILSFIDFSYNDKLMFFTKEKPNIYIFIIAIIILICFILKYLLGNKLYNNERRQYSYVIDIDEDHKICVKQGDISSYKGDIDKAILLPANTSFDEKCITDMKSALGCYFLKNYPENIEKIKNTIIEIATKNFSLSEGKKCSNIGDTILLKEYDGKKINIIISAVTEDCPDVGIQANAIGIISAVKNTIAICSENRYSSITMPIIGTGHGGIKHSISLILICVQYFLSVYHSQNHHVKELIIIVFDPDKRLKNEIDETVECIKKLISVNRKNTK